MNLSPLLVSGGFSVPRCCNTRPKANRREARNASSTATVVSYLPVPSRLPGTLPAPRDLPSD